MARCLQHHPLMGFPLHVTFRGVGPSDVLESMIRERAARLETFRDRIVRCHVIVYTHHWDEGRGQLYAVRIDVATTAREVSATRDSPTDPLHEDFIVLVEEAFDAIARQLEDETRAGVAK